MDAGPIRLLDGFASLSCEPAVDSCWIDLLKNCLKDAVDTEDKPLMEADDVSPSNIRRGRGGGDEVNSGFCSVG